MMMDVPRILSQLHTDWAAWLGTGSVHSDSEGAGDGLTGSSLVHRVCGCGSVDSCCCVKSTRPLHCRLLPTNKEILHGFYLSLLLPKTFCAIRSQWQRRWFSPRPTFCCPSSFVEAGSDWCVFEFWLNRTTNKLLFYTAGEYFGQLIFDVWNNKLFCSPGRKKSVSIRFLKEPLYLLTFCMDCILWLTFGMGIAPPQWTYLTSDCKFTKTKSHNNLLQIELVANDIRARTIENVCCFLRQLEGKYTVFTS